MRIVVTGGSGFIGTHVIGAISRLHPTAVFLNLDLQEPKRTDQRQWWKKCDLMDSKVLCERMLEFGPSHLIHMAARTDPDGKTVEEYEVNTVGSANVLVAASACGTLQRAVFYSTQYVVRPGPLATSDREYRPVNEYGESKRIMEEMIRTSDAQFLWTIVRPTNIWGPWHPRYADEFWLVLKKGRYVHPGGAAVVRAYGYVGNVAQYTAQIIDAPGESVASQTFYLGDPVGDIGIWVSAFSRALTGRDPRIVPRAVLRMIALLGDCVRVTGYPFPLFTGRYKSMTSSYEVDMSHTFETFGLPKYSLEEGVAETVQWLKTQGTIWNS